MHYGVIHMRIAMAGWLHGVFVGDRLFVFPLCGFSLSLFCNCIMELSTSPLVCLCRNYNSVYRVVIILWD